LFYIVSQLKPFQTMQKRLTNLLSLVLVSIFFSTALVAQEAPAQAEKKVFISIHGRDAQGRKITKTTTQTGEAAKNFDVKKYVKENSEGLTDVVVSVGENAHDIKGESWQRNRYFNDKNHAYEGATAFKKDPKGFLGVSQKESDFNNETGVPVKITRNSSAAKGGLKDGDVLLKLNAQSVNTFNDVHVFMQTTKPNDKIQVTFARDGETKTVTATLGQPEDAWAIKTEEKEACLGVYTSTNRNTQRGAIIQDFTPISAAQEVSMQLGDKITAINGINVNGHQELWDEIAKYTPQQKVRVSYIRKDADMLITATLKACKPNAEKVIVVPEAPKDAKKIDITESRQLKLDNFATFPNPIQDMVDIRFQGEAVPTTVSFYDINGKTLFQQTMTDFDGDYNQRFDVSAYAKGVILVRVLQGDKVFAQKIVVN
jgi:PDZ domain-containing secreted protein